MLGDKRTNGVSTHSETSKNICSHHLYSTLYWKSYPGNMARKINKGHTYRKEKGNFINWQDDCACKVHKKVKNSENSIYKSHIR